MGKLNRDGFTLIELLVVVAIIGLLAAILLPALSRGGDGTPRIQCVNNLRQQGIAFQTFLTDNHCYPLWVSPTNNDPPGRWWADQLERGGFGIFSPAADFHQRGVWRCPSARPRNGNLVNCPYYGYNAFGVLHVGNLANNFGFSGHRTENPPTLAPIGESEVAAPAEMMAIGESDAFAFMRAQSYDFWGGQLRHHAMVNVLLCDGHIESPKSAFLFDDTNEVALARWNRDHLPHSDRLSR